MEFKFSQSLIPRTLRYSLFNSISTHNKQLHLHVQICRCQIQGMSSNFQDSTKKILVHVVKQGETLNSISRLYGVSISDIVASNEEVVDDLDLVCEGQQLNIPSSIPTPVQKCRSEMIQSPESSFRRASSCGLYSRILNLKNSTLPSSHHVSYAKTSGYFLVLVPLVAFCIRCIIGALNNRRDGESERRHHQRPKRTRWKTALQDLRDPDEPDSDPFIEDEDQIESNNDNSQTYSKLEEDYQKFLSECGMSQWGYWRGGSSSSS